MSAPFGSSLQQDCSCITEQFDLSKILQDNSQTFHTDQVNPIGEALPIEYAPYRILRLLAKGGFGEVYLAENRLLKIPVCIKAPRLDSKLSSEGANQNILQEARLLVKFKHRQVVRFFDVFKMGDNYCLILEYLEGQTLGQLMKIKKKLHWRKALRLIRSAASGLQAIHEQGFIHLDLTPNNLWISPNGEVIILDLGLAKAIGSLASVKDIEGTVEYLSPEQCDAKLMGPYCDIYSLGIIFLCCLTGQKPFHGNHWELVNFHLSKNPIHQVENFLKDIPVSLIQVIEKMTAVSSTARYQNVQELFKALDSLEFEKR